MSILVLVYWTSLLIPGYALARRVDPEGVQSGFMSALALSFVAAAAALSVVAIPGYVLGVPLALLTLAAGGLVLWGVVDLAVQRRWGEVAGLALGVLGLEIAIVLGDLVLSARVGSILGADAVVHVARVRFLLEQGLSNRDPFIGGDFFYPSYHTNLIHALLASAAQATRTDPLVTWFSSLAAAKALVVSGAWYAGWAIFRSRAAAWVAALFVLGSRGPVTFMLYPNQLAPWFLVPVLLGCVVRTIVDGPDRNRAIAIAAVMLVVAQTHAIYAVFVAMTIAPVFTVWAVIQWWRRAEHRRAALLCVAAFAIAAPFPVVTYATTAHHPASGIAAGGDRPSRAEETREQRQARKARIKVSGRLKVFDNGWVMHKFGRGFTGRRGLGVLLAAMACSAMVLVGRRREMVWLLAVLLTVAAWLHVPPLCTALVRAAGAEWIVHRLGAFQDVIFALLLPGSLAASVETMWRERAAGESRPWLSWTVFRWSLGVVCVFAGALFGSHRSPYNWTSYLRRAGEPANTRLGRDLRPMLRFSDELREHVRPNAVVVCDPSMGMRAVMARHCRIITSTSSSIAVPDHLARGREVKRIIRNRTPAEEREALIDEYDVTYALLDRPAPAWVLERISEYWLTEYGWCVVRLRPPGEPADTILGDYDQALLDAGRIEEAIPLLLARVERAPDHFGAQFRLGRALAQTGRADEAIAAFEAARRLRPRDARPVIMLGNAYADLGRFEEAIETYYDTLDLAEGAGDDRAVASAWFNIGNMHYRRGEWDDALDAYADALEANPYHDEAAHWRDEAMRRIEEGASSPPAATRDDDVP
ncbi:MAG: tetratricopeptide repeat protein [Planctomycetes bacterium]|nr:tetratricopeptide repeat protein [Planctomycetota bacterium]